eukprot:583368-Alexandrium_andersonii.AAC.1
MSASLVGSEMCIRDRALGDQKPTTPGQESEQWRGVMEALHGQDWCSDSVSYTHLTLPTICSV